MRRRSELHFMVNCLMPAGVLPRHSDGQNAGMFAFNSFNKIHSDTNRGNKPIRLHRNPQTPRFMQQITIEEIITMLGAPLLQKSCRWLRSLPHVSTSSSTCLSRRDKAASCMFVRTNHSSDCGNTCHQHVHVSGLLQQNCQHGIQENPPPAYLEEY